MSSNEVVAMNMGLDEYGLNTFVSDLISVHRSINDKRPFKCQRIQYNIQKLPNISVVISFYNEPWSTLIRTIWSVLHTVPESLLTEIILVDDYSDKEHLKRKLNSYVTQLPRTHLLRNTKRLGLIRSRVIGAEKARGEVVAFLDSHSELNNGWVEPLLARIRSNPETVVSPILATINWNTFEFTHDSTQSPYIGGFDWRLSFQWRRNERPENSPSDPISTPTIPGGTIAVSKSFFDRLGQFDGDMEIWGGENIELSFRTWMCGGRVEIIPCSIVGHVNANKSPYSRTEFLMNSARTAEVWMDEFARHFYIRNPKARVIEERNLEQRKTLRKDLKCKSFKWYLQNVYSEIYVPEDRNGFYGSLSNKGFKNQVNKLKCYLTLF